MPTTTTASDATAFQDFLAALSARDRANIEKHIAVLDAEPSPSHAKSWRQVALLLRRLAPMAANTIGPQVVQFFVADGKYRMQVFALEDLQDGHVTVYCPDVIDAAVKAGVLGASARLPGQAAEGEARVYAVPGSHEPLRVEPLDKSSVNPGAHYKDMLGWNRKAVRVTLPPGASAAQIEATEMLCALASRTFPKAPAAPGNTPAGGHGKKGSAVGK